MDWKMMPQKLVAFIAAFIMLALALSGCSGNDTVVLQDESENTRSETERQSQGGTGQIQGVTDNEIVIGSVSALGGHASFLGTQLTRGSQAYFNKVNENGGINGRKIRFVTADDEYEPVNTVRETKRMIADEKVFFLFDYVGTPTAKEALPLVNDAKIPIVGLFTGAEFLRNPFQPYVFNIRASYNQEAEAIIDYWQQKGKKNVAIFYQDDAFGLSVLSGAKIALQKYSSAPVALSSFKRGELPTPGAVQQIVNAKPDAVIMVGTYTALAKFVEMAKKSDLKNADYHTVSFVGSEAFAEELGKFEPFVSENVIVSQVVPDPHNTNVPVVKEYQELFAKYFPQDKFNYDALEGFINAKIVVEALRRAGKNLTREGFIKQLEGLSGYDVGVNIEIKVSSANHQMFNKVFLSKLEKGSFLIMN